MRVTVSFLRKYAGGTLLDTSSQRNPAFRCTYMNKYQYLLSKKENGELSILFELGHRLRLFGGERDAEEVNANRRIMAEE